MQDMLSRIYTRLVRKKLANFPAVAILGPRQCGKTTLARRLRGLYFDMETQGDVARLDAEWDDIAAGRGLVVIDEAQAAPHVFSRLRGTIDADRSFTANRGWDTVGKALSLNRRSRRSRQRENRPNRSFFERPMGMNSTWCLIGVVTAGPSRSS